MPRARPAVRGLMAAVALVAVVLGAYRLGRDSVPVPELVYVTRTGTHYHREGCRHLRGGSVRTPLDEARARFRPCATCKPPL